MERLSGRVALVTGAAQGLGAALADRLMQEGCRVARADLNDITTSGPDRLALRADVTSSADCAAMVDATRAHFGRLDILVANAGIVIAGDALELGEDDWRRVMEVNLTGYFLSAQAAARAMAVQEPDPHGQRGCIVQINSKSGKRGSRANGAYAASKFGGIGLTQSLALDLAPRGIRVNAVCPGNLLDGTLWQESLFEQYARTRGQSAEEVRRRAIEQVPLGRGATYDDVAGVVVFLCSDEARYMTGQALNVTGGQEMG